MKEHLGYEKNSAAGDNSGNSRNGHTEKTVLMENHEATIEVPRDRNSTFELVIVPKHEKRVPIFNDQLISMYSLRMSDRDKKSHLEKSYAILSWTVFQDLPKRFALYILIPEFSCVSST